MCKWSDALGHRSSVKVLSVQVVWCTKPQKPIEPFTMYLARCATGLVRYAADLLELSTNWVCLL
jgi:hypothetical protein